MRTPKFRISYPHLFTPQINQQSGKPEYSALALFEKGADFTELKQAAAAAGTEMWGQDKSKWPKNLLSPFRTEKKDGTLPSGLEAGAVFMNFKSKTKVLVVGKDGKTPITEEQELYAGCWCYGSVTASAYDVAGNKGIKFYLNGVQKVADGEKLSGGHSATSDFTSVVEAHTQASDATADADEVLPF